MRHIKGVCFKSVPSWKDYFVSEDGQVFSERRYGKMLKPIFKDNVYVVSWNTTTNGKVKKSWLRVDKMVGEAWHGIAYNKTESVLKVERRHKEPDSLIMKRLI